jgi:hypothetical protein
MWPNLIVNSGLGLYDMVALVWLGTGGKGWIPFVDEIVMCVFVFACGHSILFITTLKLNPHTDHLPKPHAQPETTANLNLSIWCICVFDKDFYQVCTLPTSPNN